VAASLTHLLNGSAMPNDLIAGFLSSAVLIIAIGAQNAFVLRQGLLREHVLPLVLLCAGADALLIAAGIAGLGALIAARPELLDLVRYGGAAFLFAYAIASARRAWRAERLTVAEGGGAALGSVLATGLAFTFLNPHVYLDTVVLLGALASQRPDGPWVFGAGAAAASFVWFFTLGYGARFLVPVFARPLAWRILDGLISLTMLGLGTAVLAG
jgi:L-lysine exporter family protein LysE/ArgO